MTELCFLCRKSRLLVQAWGHFPKREHSKLNHPVREEVSPFQLTPSVSGSTAIFQQSAVGFLHIKSVEVPPLQGLMFCKAVTDFAVSMMCWR